MSPSEMIEPTILFVTQAMAGKVDLAGKPIIEHVMRVMAMLGDRATPEEKLAALLHDVVEDTPVTIEDLRRFGYPEEVVVAVELLTHIKERDTYFQYVRAIYLSGNAIALRVKMADNLDNGDPKRLAATPIDEVTRSQLALRYRKAWNILIGKPPLEDMDEPRVAADVAGAGFAVEAAR